MKQKVVIFILFVGIMQLTSYAQGYFSIATLMEFTKIKTLANFDAKIKSYGYIFVEAYENEHSTDYTYQKQTVIGDTRYTNFIYYRDMNLEEPLISFTSAIPAFAQYVNTSLSPNGFKLQESDAEGKSMIFTYKNSTYTMQVITTSKEEEYSERRYNSTQVRLWKTF